MQAWLVRPHVPSLSFPSLVVLSKAFGYVHLIRKITLLPTVNYTQHLKPVNHDVRDYNGLAIARLDVLDPAISRRGGMDSVQSTTVHS